MEGKSATKFFFLQNIEQADFGGFHDKAKYLVINFNAIDGWFCGRK